MLAVLEIKNISVHTSGDNQVQGTATFTQSEKDGLKNIQINVFTKGQLAQELANYTRGIATGHLRFARLENAEGNKTTRVTFVLENFAPTSVATADLLENIPSNAVDSGFITVDSSDEEIPF